MRPISPDYSRRFRAIGHPHILLGDGGCHRAVYRNLTNSNLSVVLALTTTIHIFFRWQSTIFPHTFPPQLFRWRYILNVFPCVKYNYSIYIFSTTFRVIYHSRFSVSSVSGARKAAGCCPHATASQKKSVKKPRDCQGVAAP